MIVSVYCPYCRHLVCKTDGSAESDCRRCGAIVMYDKQAKQTTITREPKRTVKYL